MLKGWLTKIMKTVCCYGYSAWFVRCFPYAVVTKLLLLYHVLSVPTLVFATKTELKFEKATKGASVLLCKSWLVPQIAITEKKLWHLNWGKCNWVLKPVAWSKTKQNQMVCFKYSVALGLSIWRAQMTVKSLPVFLCGVGYQKSA